MINERHIADRVWHVIESVGICMMTTRFEGGLRARPLEARPDRNEKVIWFLTDRRGLKDDEIEAHSDVCLVFFCPKQKVYLSITGSAFVSQNPSQAEKLWNQEQQVWWPGGPADPNLLIIRFEPALAEMWDGPASSAVAAYEFVKARITGKKPNLGEKKKITVRMD
jgi:general stress protein 26